jgi:hypothetical protein
MARHIPPRLKVYPLLKNCHLLLEAIKNKKKSFGRCCYARSKGSNGKKNIRPHTYAELLAHICDPLWVVILITLKEKLSRREKNLEGTFFW